MGVDHHLLPAAAIEVAGCAFYRAKEQRSAGRLDDARQTTRCLAAFARKLARSDPDEPAFHVLRCIAFEQEAKDAWEVKDHAAIQAALSGRWAKLLPPCVSTPEMRDAHARGSPAFRTSCSSSPPSGLHRPEPRFLRSSRRKTAARHTEVTPSPSRFCAQRPTRPLPITQSAPGTAG